MANQIFLLLEWVSTVNETVRWKRPRSHLNLFLRKGYLHQDIKIERQSVVGVQVE